MIKVLVTGFDAFPGARHNPTLALLAALRRRRTHFARRGMMLTCHALPVVYAGLHRRLAGLAAKLQPDAILHFGLASRRKIISVETRACNRANPLHPDAAGALPDRSALLPDGPWTMHARVPAPQIVSALRRAGIASGLSRDAGDYVCNATLYHSLAASHAAAVGFIHIPRPRHAMARPLRRYNERPPLADIVKAAEIALFIVATAARQDRLHSA